MYPIAESSRVGLAAVDKCWKRYPSLKHHSLAYGKCAPWRALSPHCWRGEEDNTRAPARAWRDATIDTCLTTETHGGNGLRDSTGRLLTFKFHQSQTATWYNMSRPHISRPPMSLDMCDTLSAIASSLGFKQLAFVICMQPTNSLANTSN